MKTFVYVDGFNLYYGAVKGTRYRWLDLKALVERLLRPEHRIEKIKYFTAPVSALPNNPNAPARQNAYLRALRSIGGIEIIYGHFLTHPVNCLRADGCGMVRVFRTEEKGSDVNLATHLVADAFRTSFDAAVVVSNDSDLREPIRIVTQELGMKVGVLLPVAKKDRRPSRELIEVATFCKRIRTGAVAAAQLPKVVTVDGQKVHCPAEWE